MKTTAIPRIFMYLESSFTLDTNQSMSVKSWLAMYTLNEQT